MKNKAIERIAQWFGIIAMVTIIGFSFGACGDGNGGETAPVITTTTLPNGTTGTAYNQTLVATGDAPITWTIESGTLPTGLSLATAGAITGTPTVANTYTFTVKTINAAGSNTKQLSITIVEPLVEMVQIQGGTFTMGSPTTELNRYSDETEHQVTLTGFKMSKHPVTQAQYEAVTGNNPSNFKTPVAPETSTATRPVEQVTWYDAVEFCNKLSEQEGLTSVYTITGKTPATGYPIINATVTADWNKNGYRLPTEAQWEYACRAGTTTPFNTGNNITTDQANYDGNFPYNNNPVGAYLERTTAVGSYAPNQWGLYDMHGNVFEWCWDWYGTYESDMQSDPTGAVSGPGRMLRGGSWINFGLYLRSAFRNIINGPSYWNNNIGFRLVRP
jgi:formylglycine-generating enzyme required for sulfatase activity